MSETTKDYCACDQDKFSRPELKSIRDRALRNTHQITTRSLTLEWAKACVALAEAADALDMLAARKEAANAKYIEVQFTPKPKSNE